MEHCTSIPYIKNVTISKVDDHIWAFGIGHVIVKISKGATRVPLKDISRSEQVVYDTFK